MKKKLLIALAVIICLAAIGAMIYASVKLNDKSNEEDKHLVELSVAELQEKINNKETFVLVFTQTTCSHCAAYKPKLKHVLTKYNLTGYEITIDKLTEQEIGQVRTIANTEGNGTPTTVFIINGEEQRTSSRLIGDQAESNIENRLRQLNYIE